MMVARSDVIARIEARLADRLGADALAAWAFNLFYELDQGRSEVAPEDADVVADVLDELLFADDESFALDEADLRRLLARLQHP
jgi:hypothetical protein